MGQMLYWCICIFVFVKYIYLLEEGITVWVEVQGWMTSPGWEGTEKDNRLLTDGGSQYTLLDEGRREERIQTKAMHCIG